MVHRAMTVVLNVLFGFSQNVQATTDAPTAFCETYPSSPHCDGGQVVSCSFCHSTAPDLNPFGACIQGAMPAGGAFTDRLAQGLAGVEGQDCDGDSYRNLLEIESGTRPGDNTSKPVDGNDAAKPCDAAKAGSDWDICGYDPVFALRRVYQDFCGYSPDFEVIAAFRDLSTASQQDRLDEALEECIQSEYWIGRDGVLWSLAHSKIQPLRTIKSGENGGTIPLGDYDDDYNLFVYHQMENRDVRGILTADYFVQRTDGDPTSYVPVDEVPMHPEAGGVVRLVAPVFDNTQQFVLKAQRAGMLTTLWNAVSKTMFTSVARTNAATAMRSFLNIDISKGEGLNHAPPASFTLTDYDNKGVTQPACAFCHRVLDAATYPFMRHNGLSFLDPTGGINIGDIFDPNGTTTIPVPRIARLLINNPTSEILVPGIYKENRATLLAGANADTEPGLAGIPLTGYLLGKPVASLREWAAVAADSDEFARATVLDYWRLLVGREPGAAEEKEFTQLWQDLKSTGNYSINTMLRQLIRTEAYGAP